MSIPQYIIDRGTAKFDELLKKVRRHRDFHVLGPLHGYKPDECPECKGKSKLEDQGVIVRRAVRTYSS